MGGSLRGSRVGAEGREREAVQGGRCPSTDGRGKQGKQGGLTHKNREDSFTKPGGVLWKTFSKTVGDQESTTVQLQENFT